MGEPKTTSAVAVGQFAGLAFGRNPVKVTCVLAWFMFGVPMGNVAESSARATTV